MNREIKFKVWDKESKKFLTNEWLGHYDDFYFEDLQKVLDNLNGINNMVLLQFTGLLDSKGVEIYEGDIVKDGRKNGGITKVEWNAGGWEIWVSYDEVAISRGAKEYSGIRIGYWVEEAMKELEVIGSIYENPELLN